MTQDNNVKRKVKFVAKKCIIRIRFFEKTEIGRKFFDRSMPESSLIDLFRPVAIQPTAPRKQETSDRTERAISFSDEYTGNLGSEAESAPRSLDNHFIPAKAGVHSVPDQQWTPAPPLSRRTSSARVTSHASFIPLDGPQDRDHSEWHSVITLND